MKATVCDVCGEPISVWGGSFKVTHTQILWFGTTSSDYDLCPACWAKFKEFVRDTKADKEKK